MKVIYKYKLKGVVCEIELPVGYFGLQVGVQGTDIVIWAMIDDQIKEKVKTKFRIYGTGHEISQGIEMDYVNTVQIGEFFWHVFKDSKDVKV